MIKLKKALFTRFFIFISFFCTSNNLYPLFVSGLYEQVQKFNNLKQETLRLADKEQVKKNVDELQKILVQLKQKALTVGVKNIPSLAMLSHYGFFPTSKLDEKNITGEEIKKLLESSFDEQNRELLKLATTPSGAPTLATRTVNYADYSQNFENYNDLNKKISDFINEKDFKNADDLLNQVEVILKVMLNDGREKVQSNIPFRAYLSVHNFFPNDKIYASNAAAKKEFEDNLDSKLKEIKAKKDFIAKQSEPTPTPTPVPTGNPATLKQELKEYIDKTFPNAKEAKEFNQLVDALDINAPDFQDKYNFLNEARNVGEKVFGSIKLKGIINDYVQKYKPKPTVNPNTPKLNEINNLLKRVNELKNKTTDQLLLKYVEALRVGLDAESKKAETEITEKQLSRFQEFTQVLEKRQLNTIPFSKLEGNNYTKYMDSLKLKLNPQGSGDKKPPFNPPQPPKPKTNEQRLSELEDKILKLAPPAQEDKVYYTNRALLDKYVKEVRDNIAIEDSETTKQFIESLDKASNYLTKPTAAVFNEYRKINPKIAANEDLQKAIGRVKEALEKVKAKPTFNAYYAQFVPFINRIDNLREQMLKSKKSEILQSDIAKYEKILDDIYQIVGNTRIPTPDVIKKMREDLKM